MSVHHGRFDPDPTQAWPEASPPAPDGAPAGALRRRLRAQLKRRAVVDAIGLAAMVLLAPLPFADPFEALLAGLAAGGAALSLWILRRGNDLARAAAALRQPDADFQARGIPLADWHAGAPLAAWEDRQLRA